MLCPMVRYGASNPPVPGTPRTDAAKAALNRCKQDILWHNLVMSRLPCVGRDARQLPDGRAKTRNTHEVAHENEPESDPVGGRHCRIAGVSRDGEVERAAP